MNPLNKVSLRGAGRKPGANFLYTRKRLYRSLVYSIPQVLTMSRKCIDCWDALCVGKYSDMGPETQLSDTTLPNLALPTKYGLFTQVFTRYPVDAAWSGDGRYPVIVWGQGQGLFTIAPISAQSDGLIIVYQCSRQHTRRIILPSLTMIPCSAQLPASLSDIL